MKKELIRKVMLAHLTRIGYPEISNMRIMQELPELFRVLDRRDLIPPEMTFQHFNVIAQNEFIKALRKGFI